MNAIVIEQFAATNVLSLIEFCLPNILLPIFVIILEFFHWSKRCLRCQFSKGYNFISITLNKFSKLFIGVKYKREVVNYYLHFRGNKFETMLFWKKRLLIFLLRMKIFHYIISKLCNFDSPKELRIKETTKFIIIWKVKLATKLI